MNEVKSPKKPLLYYYLLMLLVLLLFNLLAMPWISEHQIKEVDYNTFVSMVEKKEIGKVDIQEQDNRILFTDTEEKSIYKTAMVPDDDLVSRLLEAGISTSGTEIQQTSLLVSILCWVLPIIIFIGLGQMLSRSLMKKMGGGNSMMFNMGKSNAKVYVKSAEGMVVGVSPKQEDITVNVCKKKQMTNMRAAGSDDALRLVPPRRLSLEQCLEFLADDELLEVTPENLRIRKTILNHEKRMKASHGGKKK